MTYSSNPSSAPLQGARTNFKKHLLGVFPTKSFRPAADERPEHRGTAKIFSGGIVFVKAVCMGHDMGNGTTNRLFELPLDVLTTLVAQVAEQLAHQMDGERGTSTRFHSRLPPETPVEAYIQRLVKWLPATADSVVLCLLYLRRLASQASLPLTAQLSRRRHARPLVNVYTVHRLVFACLMVASKFIADSYIPSQRTSKVAGLSQEECLTLEVEMLAQLSFRLYFTVEELEATCSALWSRHQHSDHQFDLQAWTCSLLHSPGDGFSSSSTSSEEGHEAVNHLADMDLDVSLTLSSSPRLSTSVDTLTLTPKLRSKSPLSWPPYY